MGSKNFGVKLEPLFILVGCVVLGAQLVKSDDFDVTKYGAKPGGTADMAEALTKAWAEACASTTAAKIIIPTGTFLLGPVVLEGPCKALIEIQVQATVKAGKDLGKFKTDGWIIFNHINHFTMSGNGAFDGEGELAWKGNNCHKSQACQLPPANLRFNFLDNAVIQDVSSLNSKSFHVNVLGCNNITFQRFKIVAPESSVNTDGIHIGRSNEVKIVDTTIKTGDDCISVGDGTKKLLVENVECGPGHGISVGSLGKYADEEDVAGIIVKNCTLTGTTNGVRVKTWPSAPGTCSVSDLHFEDIKMVNVENPVIIDQQYCPWGKCDLDDPSKVKITGVNFKNIKGTSSTPVAVKLLCSPSHPCDVSLAEINIRHDGGTAVSECANVKPTTTGQIFPAACTNTAADAPPK